MYYRIINLDLFILDLIQSMRLLTMDFYLFILLLNVNSIIILMFASFFILYHIIEFFNVVFNLKNINFYEEFILILSYFKSYSYHSILNHSVKTTVY